MWIDSRRLHGIVISAGLAALALVSSPLTAGDWDLGVRAGYFTDIEESFVGFEALTTIEHSRFVVNPNGEIVLVDNGDLYTLSLDLHYDLPLGLSDSDVWFGAGPTVLIRDPDHGDNKDDFGLNLLAGLGRRSGSVRPYGQVKVTLADDSWAVLAVGVRFF